MRKVFPIEKAGWVAARLAEIQTSGGVASRRSEPVFRMMSLLPTGGRKNSPPLGRDQG